MNQATSSKTGKLDNSVYEAELHKLQVELCKMQAWVQHTGTRIIVIFEGQDGAGKGGMIRAITARVDSRVFRVVALPIPNETEKSQIYLQRYVQHFPAGGEVVIFDRSYYNRSGVERVMGFCTDREYRFFMDEVADFERWIVEGETYLIKYWMEVPNAEQLKRFMSRIDDPAEQWKLSPLDLDARTHWYAYARARDAMFECSDTDLAPWHIVDCGNTQRAHLNCISHLLSLIPYEAQPSKPVALPERDESDAYDDEGAIKGRRYIPNAF
jgi:polyphosphate kinase 2